VLWESIGGEPELILLATGSEVVLALEAGRRLAADGARVRVVSMPSFELFADQEESYRVAVLPPSCAVRLAVEAASPFGWHRWVGDRGEIVALDGFGASAPAEDLAAHFGFTAEALVARGRRMLLPARKPVP
jgi:transketolase